MNKIITKNPKLRSFIKQTIGLPRYGEPYDTLVEEVFVREQHVLGLTREEFFEDLKNFTCSINKFSFEQTNENWMGCAFPGSKEIQFNLGYWQDRMNTLSRDQYCEEFFETFSHECLHGMQTQLNGKNRAGGYDYEIGNRKHALYEIATQGIAAKMARNQTVVNFNNNDVLTGDGYSDEIFAMGLMAATFGVSEQDVLKYSVRDRNSLVKALDINIGNPNTTASLINLFESQLEYLHSINYPDDSQKSFKGLSPEKRREMSTTAMSNIVEIAQFCMQERIKNIPLDITREQSRQLKSDFKKVYDIFTQEKIRFANSFDSKTSFANKFVRGEKAEYIINSIDVLDQATGSKDKNVKNSIPAYVNSVRLGNFDEIRNHGISLRSDKSFLRIRDESEEQIYEKAYKDYNDFAEWDNYVINSAIYDRTKVESNQLPKKDVHSNIDRYSQEGIKKVEALRLALISNKLKYSKRSKEILYKFLTNGDEGLHDAYSRITRTPIAGSTLSPRNEFMNNFGTDKDRAFLAELIAQTYVNKCFDKDGTLKPRENKDDYITQISLFQTFEKYDEFQVKTAISSIILNDDYSYVSGEYQREQLAVLGNRRMFEIFSQPLIEELTNTRNIIPEKKDELRRMAVATEEKYPDTMAWRFGKMVEQYRDGHWPDPKLITGSVRKNFSYYFQSERGMEDLVGILCDSYSSKMELLNLQGASYISRQDAIFRNTIEKYDKDYFRENMIRMVLHNDDSGFISKDEAVAYQGINPVEAIQFLSHEFIEEAKFYERNVFYRENNPITEFDRGQVDIVGVLSGNRRNTNKLGRVVGDLRSIKQTGVMPTNSIEKEAKANSNLDNNNQNKDDGDER